MKITLSGIAILLTIIGYIPYLKDLFERRTKPHMFTWASWTLIALVTFILQINNGGGVGSYVTFVVTLFCVFVFILSISRGTKDIRIIDYICLGLSIIALVVYLIFDSSTISVLLVTSADLLGFLPTVRKTWNEPYSETMSLYNIGIVRHFISVLALEKVNFVTGFYSIFWVVFSIFFITMVYFRKMIVKNKNYDY